MIIWFTGQPNSGKTTLALEVVHFLHEIRKDITATIIDGDSLRKVTRNTDYSKDGRRKNVNYAINLAINSAAASGNRRRPTSVASFTSAFRAFCVATMARTAAAAASGSRAINASDVATLAIV